MFAQRSPIERAVIAFITPHLLPSEKELVRKNEFKMTFLEMDWRLNDLTGGTGRIGEFDSGQFTVHSATAGTVHDRYHSTALVRTVDLGLTDKVAVVTGSSRGLGLASARALVAEGCRVCLCARGAEQLAEAALEVEAAAQAPEHDRRRCRPTSRPPPASSSSINRAVETFGGLDILVNNVGLRARRRSARHDRRRVAGGVRPDAVSRDPRVAARRAAHEAARRRRRSS